VTAASADPQLGTLEAAALDLRAQHRVVARRAREIPLLVRLDAMPAWLAEARARLASPEPVLAKAADWLLDNDYLVERAIRQLGEDLPSGFYGRLPRLVSGEAEGLPRVFSIAHGLLHATHLQLSLDAAVRFVDAYQRPGEALTIAELWAFPALLRAACLELLTTSLERSMPELAAPAAATLPAQAPTGLDDTDCVARALANLRVVDAISWKDFFTRTSRVEAALASDPAGVYPRMEFETCDRYRRAVEALALASGRAELDVAERVVEHARSKPESDRALDHVGTWLVGEGAPEFARAVGCRAPARERLVSWAERRAGPLYAIALALATGAAAAVPALYLHAAGASPLALLAGVAVALLPASVVSFTLVHWVITLCVTPRPLAKLDFSKGIPSDCRCAVVIPALAMSPRAARELVAQLEEHYLASSDPALEFALLTDWADAPAERMPEDDEIVAALRAGIRELGVRYGRAGQHPFHLLHRPRRWNPAERCWMGWERKRGKLEELNQLLAGGRSNAFCVREGTEERLAGIRFVVTLDADTRLPPGSVARLVGTLAHPLNRARFDEASGRVVGGYTVVQPRVEIAPEAGNRSWFARLYAGDTAIDIYTRAVSDVYQDLFGAGTFVGKGIYEVASFGRSLAGRVPENALASHDLFEGAHGRVALASDIVLYEGFPSRYAAFARRWHRWVRGDWQLLPWLGRRVPGPEGARLSNRLSLRDRWKILDNLRRSLLPPALVLLLVAGWLALPGSPWVWTGLGVAAPAAYLFTDLVTGLSRGRRRGAVRGTLRAAVDHAGRWALSVTFLAQDAAYAVDAIVRTLWRLGVTRRGLLEWTSAADVEAQLESRGSRWRSWRRLAAGPVSALAAGLALASLRPSALPAAAGVLVLWALSPEIAQRIARPRGTGGEPLRPDDRLFLRRLARRTWLYFETFVGPEDHWLPPDNLQEHPRREVAHRTSPTNIGMALLSTLAAADFGYLGSSELVVRVRNTLETLARIPRFRGHVLNWIDTRSLEPLEPRYVSAVDSGNLAVSLVALEQGCLELARGSALRPELWDGLLDVLALLADALAAVFRAGDAAPRARIVAMEECARAARPAPERWRAALARLCEVDRPALDAALGEAGDLESAPAEALRELRTWLERMHHHLRAMEREFEDLAPWWGLLDAPPPACEELARALRGLLSPGLPLAELEARCGGAAERLTSSVRELHEDAEVLRWTHELRASLEKGAAAGGALRHGLGGIAKDAGALAWGMDFAWLYDPDTRRLRIGYNATADRLDPNHYDLLASEARLASFFAIAKGDAPLEHWFHLGRPITRAAGGLALMSWGGSMFEYLMPPLLLRSQAGTLLAQSERAAVDTQRRWAAQLGVPWGASESAFASLDPGGRYRYQSFGVPGLGLRRGLARDRVVAPYASALALPIRARAAAENLRALDALALGGIFGLFEAADFTPERLAPGRRVTPVRSYMAHHQGMILAALDNALHGDVLVRRFHADLRMRATELLLHERIPRELPSDSSRSESEGAVPAPSPAPPPLHAWTPAGIHDAPRVHLLGNGRLCSWISMAGAGALRWHGQAVTRFRPDATRDDSGVWLYVRDEADGAIWSVGRQPVGLAGDESTVTFHPHQAEFHRRDRGIAIRMEVFVPPGDDLEVRRLSVANESDRPRVLNLVSYGEIVLAPPLEDERHPAFSKLFVGAEWLPGLDGLLFTRRPRQPREQPPVVLHRMIPGDERSRCVGFEADRAAFLGRGGELRRPRGVRDGLGGSTGYTLDPVMALQVRVTLEPDERCELALLTFAGGSRESVLEAAGRYATLAALEWASADAAADAAREAQRLSLDPGQLPELQALASLLLHPHGALAAAPARRAANRLGQSRLWGLGLSGDVPILLLRCSETSGSTLLEQIVRGHEWWRRRGLEVDVVVLRSGLSAYVEPLRERLFATLRAAGGHEALGGRGGVHLLFSDQLPDEERCLLECAARVVLDDTRGSLAQQLEAAPRPPELPPSFQASEPPVSAPGAAALERPSDLLFDNGLGGFTPDGREYVIHLDAGVATPAPWCNVLANDGFGSIVSESGVGFTWCGNSGENRLTPWTNDPVADPPSEALYLRDEQSGEVWTPTPRPAGRGSYQVRHGAGYSVWRSVEQELEAELLVFVPADDPVKVARLRIRNRVQRPRRVTATYWAEWLLGALPSVSRPHVVAQWEPAGPALLARNPWSADFADRVAFLAATAPPHGVTADRREFIGPEGSAADPAALRRWGLSGRVEPGIDTGAAYQVHFDLAAGGSAEVAFVLGQGRDRAHALELVVHWRDAGRIEAAVAELGALWERRLGAVQVRTGDAGFDLLANRWLLHQVLSSRVLARAGFYQAGGAYGFRDQLQDVLALLHSEPERARAHLLACAAHQFEEGDVLHWWHPPADRGVRTRCSDDLLWLPWAASQYVEATGDASILDEDVTFLHAPPLAAEEHDRYARFEPGRERRSLLEHCQRALERGVTRGPHGLPRIGAGDWNDGFDRIGARGRGESVWLGWFAVAAMRGVGGLCERRGDAELARRWRERAAALAARVDETAWDGEWWVRAFDDDGRAFGSRNEEECRIDSIAQSWAVLSGGAPEERARCALSAARRELVREQESVVRLFWPPFDATPRDPGYVKAYPPGLRENGGQYTHAAAWLAWAFAALGDGDAAHRLFTLMSPLSHTGDGAALARYRVEPYVIAADVAGAPPHVGRGGWTWYTGSAAWTWRLAVEAILGLRLREGRLELRPCLPGHWSGFSAELRAPTGGALSVRVIVDPQAPAELRELCVDGVPRHEPWVAFPREGETCRVELRIGRSAR
jgi:cyclic beta-1,2-glucan synthetase